MVLERVIIFIMWSFACISERTVRRDNGVVLDAVVLVATKDIPIATSCVSNLKFFSFVRKVFVVCSKPDCLLLENNIKKTNTAYDDIEIQYCDEIQFSVYFSKNNISAIMGLYDSSFSGRIGWYYQQLVKMYAGFVLHDISDSWLVFDADTILLRPVHFISPDGVPLYYAANNRNTACEAFIRNILGHSVLPAHYGPVHHMVFQRTIMRQLMREVLDHHMDNDNILFGFWRRFLLSIDKSTNRKAGVASEYVLYFTYLFHKFNSSTWMFRHLNYSDRKSNMINGSVLWHGNVSGLDYVSLHAYMRE